MSKKTKTAFTQAEMFDAITELRKVWNYEGLRYKQNLSQEDINDLDQQTTSYGINLGTLRKIFQYDA